MVWYLISDIRLAWSGLAALLCSVGPLLSGGKIVLNLYHVGKSLVDIKIFKITTIIIIFSDEWLLTGSSCLGTLYNAAEIQEKASSFHCRYFLHIIFINHNINYYCIIII